MRRKAGGVLIAAVLAVSFACSLSWAASIGNDVYGIYSETYPGIQYDVYNPTSPANPDGGYMGAWPSSATILMDDTTTYVEGSKSLRVTVPAGSTGGVWSQFGYDGTTASPKVRTYMYDYYMGTLEFSVKTDTDITIGIEWTRGAVPYSNITKKLSYFNIPRDNQWHTASVRLSAWTGIQTTSITVPVSFSITTPDTVDHTFWVDNVRWVKNPIAQGLPAIAQIKELSADVTTYAFTFSGVQPGGASQWICANQCIEYQLGYSTPSWGVQIYTDNTAADANPRYTGILSTSTSAAGLVSSTDTAATPLPMCWRISDYKLDISTLTIAPSADFKHLYCPALGPDNGYYPWMFVQDKADPNFESQSDYVTVWDLRGIHYGEGEWGPALSPNYIYIGADFSRVMAGRGYHTSKLIINLFCE